MRIHSIAQGTLPSALWWTKWERNPKKRGYMDIYVADALCGMAKLTQHCKANILQ